MKKLGTLSAVIVGAALLSGTPLALRFSPEGAVSLSLGTATAARIGAPGPRGPVSGTYTSPSTSYGSRAYHPKHRHTP
jgi:hypothetical protein